MGGLIFGFVRAAILIIIELIQIESNNFSSGLNKIALLLSNIECKPNQLALINYNVIECLVTVSLCSGAICIDCALTSILFLLPVFYVDMEWTHFCKLMELWFYILYDSFWIPFHDLFYFSFISIIISGNLFFETQHRSLSLFISVWNVLILRNSSFG